MSPRRLSPLVLSLLSGLLLFAAWPVSPLTFLIFIAFVPLLWLEQQTTSRKKFFGWTYLTLVIWNGATTWWVLNSTVPGGLSAILANSLLMCLPWIGFYNVKRKRGERTGYVALILFWLTFEYIHLNWQLSWPWLTLGNVFATHPGWVQWYELTGTSGGSLWILLVNVLIFGLLRQRLQGKSQKGLSKGPSEKPSNAHTRRYALSIGILLILPLVLSWYLKPADIPAGPGSNSPQPAGSPPSTKNIVLVQPNIDPWDEKFAAGKEQAQLQKLIRLSESQIDSNTALVVWPETAIPVAINEDEMKSNYFMAPVWDFLKRHPSVNLLTGVEGFRFYDEKDKTPYSSRVPESNKYADSYNSAALLDSSRFQVYHKSKLVPGVETLPTFLKFMSPLFEKFGGTTGGYAQQSERTVLSTYNHTYRIAPAVCYESIYGEFMSTYVRNEADIIVVITNDGWWGNTPGYHQHENYARLRAIETRCWVARSANTGISCFITPSGEIIDPQPWAQTAVIKHAIPVITRSQTFYVRFGDILSKGAVALTILLILSWLATWVKQFKPKVRRA
ncbi:MAG TPA: apolipoprotein N-acyltransferase [Puia sp.]|nr:apolipoprotein N-acyltransferase [Puia sp.]